MLDNTFNAMLLLLILLIFFLPTILAYSRDHPRRRPIIFINLLLILALVGWALIGSNPAIIGISLLGIALVGWAAIFLWVLFYNVPDLDLGSFRERG